MTVKLTTPKPFCKVEYYADDAKQNAWLVDFGADISGLIPASDKGYAVNGKYVTELPTVANGDMKFEEFSLSVGTGLEIKDAYAVYLKLAVPGNPYEVGAIVDGVEIPATKVSEGTYKVIVKGNIKVFELTHSTASNKTADAEGTSVTYTPYVKKTADAEIYTGEETTVCTRDLLNTYITGDYDATTKAFAVAIRALACETAAEYAKIAGAVLDSTTKTDIKGSSYQTRDRAGVIAALKTLYPELADVLDDNCNFYNYNKTPILLADGSGAVYANYAVTDTNMMLQAYQDYVKGESVLSSIPGNDYRVWVAPNGGTFEEATAYYYPYAAVAKVLNDAQKASVDTKYMDADGNKLDDAVVKDETKYDYKIVGANVNLGDKISLVFLANGNGENSTSALSAYYENGYKLKVTAPSGDVYYGDFRMTEVNGKEYAGVIVGVPIAFYNDALDIVIVQVDAETKAETEVSAHLQYNVLTWCANKYVFDRDYILRGVYNLGVKAKAYVEAHS